MHLIIVCVPYHIDVSRWGCALGLQAFLDHGLILCWLLSISVLKKSANVGTTRSFS